MLRIVRKVLRLPEALKQIRDRNHSFKQMREYIANGVYFISRDGQFIRVNGNNCVNVKQLFPYVSIVFVHSKQKRTIQFDSGVFLKRYQKTIFISNSKVYSFYLKENVYDSIKEKTTTLLPSLPYHTTPIVFDDRSQLLIADKAKGQSYTDEYHNEMCLELIYEAYMRVPIKEDKLEIKGIIYTVYQCVQHSDFHNNNVFWSDDSYTMIDYDGINYFPMFYDLLYYAFHNKRRINDWIEQWNLEEKLQRVLESRGLQSFENALDVYLAAYISTKIKKYNNNAKTVKHLEFQMGWARVFDFSNYPLSASKYNDYINNADSYNILW